LDSQEYVGGFFCKQSKLSQISIDIYKSNQGHRKKIFLSTVKYKSTLLIFMLYLYFYFMLLLVFFT